jgi:hypothetical protein
VCAGAAALLAAGCGSAATTTRSVRPTPQATSARSPSRAAVHPPWALPVSQDSATVVQSQPPADSCRARRTGVFTLPDPRCTPGAISSLVTQRNISSTICRTGYTETIRPSESITEPEKEASLRAYGDDAPLHDYEYDHLVPLELGGAPNDPRNLWPEPAASPNPKDELEYRLREMVCSGQISLSHAQALIARDWVAAYRRIVGVAAAYNWQTGHQ